MAWKIEFEDVARKSLDKLHRPDAERILRFLRDRIATSENPRLLGVAMVGKRYDDQWRYRVGDYRLIVRFQNGRMVVTVIEIGHRSKIYR